MATESAKKPNAEQLDKLAQGYRYVTIPDKDLYDHHVDSFWINSTEYKPGTHLVSADIATTLEDRLKVWQAGMLRMMRPTMDKETKRQVESHTNVVLRQDSNG